MKRWPRLHIRLPAPIRVALISLAFSLVITLPVLLFVYHQTDRLYEERIRDRVQDGERDMLFAYASGGLPALVDSVDDVIGTGAMRGGVVLIVDSNGHKIAGNLAGWPPILRTPTDWVEFRASELLLRCGSDGRRADAADLCSSRLDG